MARRSGFFLETGQAGWLPSFFSVAIFSRSACRASVRPARKVPVLKVLGDLAGGTQDFLFQLRHGTPVALALPPVTLLLPNHAALLVTVLGLSSGRIDLSHKVV